MAGQMSGDERPVTWMLLCGALAAPLYLVVGFAQALTRDGFDVRRHALSLLSNGEFGWIQIGNFVVSGTLVVAGAIGARRALAGTGGGMWGPILLGTYGVGLIGAGVFVADPAFGFPPGSPASPPAMSQSGLLHFVFGGLGFYALIGACFVFARRYRSLRRDGWALYSAVTGVAFLTSFVTIASGSTSSATILSFYAAVVWVWVWHSATHLKILFEGRATPSEDRSR
jgi:hypothetical membrane protein